MAKKYSSIGFYLILIIILLIPIYSWLNFSAHFDPVNLCRIKIESTSIKHNKKTIEQAVKLLKKQDLDAYTILCKNINTIGEKTCVIADPHVEEKTYLQGTQEPGCYVKGSKTIYLNPRQLKTDDLKKIAGHITKYSKFSKIFWQNKNRE